MTRSGWWASFRRLVARAAALARRWLAPPPPPERAAPPIEPLAPRDLWLVAPGTIALLVPATARRVPAAGDAAGGRPLPYGDFLGRAEMEHFAALPPIDRRALDAVDWEALARELTRGA